MHVANKLTRRLTGYSLVELLISISVIAVLTGVGTLSYRDFTRRQQVVGAARQVVAEIRLAQNEALAGKKPAACTGTLTQYNFRFDPSSIDPVSQAQGFTRYTRMFTEVVCASPNSTTVIRTSSLPSNTTTDSFSTVSFKAIGLGTTMAAGSTTTIILRGQGTGYSQPVVVSASGDIR